jgi:hypothetical protein
LEVPVKAARTLPDGLGGYTLLCEDGSLIQSSDIEPKGGFAQFGYDDSADGDEMSR